MNMPPERGSGTDRLGDLIRRTYSPPKDLRAPAALAARVLRTARSHPPATTWMDHLYRLLESPFRWVPVTVGAAAVILVIGLAIFPSGDITRESRTSIARTGEQTPPGATHPPTTGEDPLGPDFFNIAGVVDEPVSVELAEGWDAMTIEDEGSNTALVYFYSKDQIESSTGGNQPRTQ